MTVKINYPFRKQAAITLNSGQAKTLLLNGNVHDLFYLEPMDEYVSLVDFMANSWNVSGQILVIYEPYGKIRILEGDKPGANLKRVKDAWLKWKCGGADLDMKIREMLSIDKIRSHASTMTDSFETALKQAEKDPVLAMDFMRQLCVCSRTAGDTGSLLPESIVVIIEGAEMLIPEAEITRMTQVDRRMVGLCKEWFADPLFMNGRDAVVMVSESASLVNHTVRDMPQVKAIDIPAPTEDVRAQYIRWFNHQQPADNKINLWSSQINLAKLTGGLSIHALRQLLVESCHLERKVTVDDVMQHVQDYITSELGEEVVEIKNPQHTLKDLVGFSTLKTFLHNEFIPRMNSTGSDALPGAAVCGPIGCGKSFVFEAVAKETDMVVLVLKNLRSKYFGQTDVIFEKLRRVLESLSKVLIFIDEADTQFGGVGQDSHATERRLTGKIQQMMSDPVLRGKVKWLLMTARIHCLSPDIRRPGRVGDLIIPIFDPDGEDCCEFIRWMISEVTKGKPADDEMAQLIKLTDGFSPAAYASLRSELMAQAHGKQLSVEEIIAIADDRIPSSVGDTRQLQTLYALDNCTRKSLIPEKYLKPGDDLKELKKQWRAQIKQLEAVIG